MELEMAQLIRRVSQKHEELSLCPIMHLNAGNLGSLNTEGRNGNS